MRRNSLIQLSAPGRCKLTLSTLIHCVYCGEMKNDKISIKIIETDEIKEIFRVGIEDGRIRDKQWVHSEIDFTVASTSFQV